MTITYVIVVNTNGYKMTLWHRPWRNTNAHHRNNLLILLIVLFLHLPNIHSVQSWASNTLLHMWWHYKLEWRWWTHLRWRFNNVSVVWIQVRRARCMKQSHRILGAIAMLTFFIYVYGYKNQYVKAKLPNEPMWIQVVFATGTTIIILRLIKIIRSYD